MRLYSSHRKIKPKFIHVVYRIIWLHWRPCFYNMGQEIVLFNCSQQQYQSILYFRILELVSGNRYLQEHLSVHHINFHRKILPTTRISFKKLVQINVACIKRNICTWDIFFRCSFCSWWIIDHCTLL